MCFAVDTHTASAQYGFGAAAAHTVEGVLYKLEQLHGLLYVVCGILQLHGDMYLVWLMGSWLTG